MRNQREPGWLNVLAACFVIALLAVTLRMLVFLPSRGGPAMGNAEPAAAANPRCVPHPVKMPCLFDDASNRS